MSHPKIGKNGNIPRVALQVSDWTLPVAGPSFSGPHALVHKPFAHEYSLVAGLAPTPGLLIADTGIDALIFRHRLMRIGADLEIAALAPPPPQANSSSRRPSPYESAIRFEMYDAALALRKTSVK
jgi:hypothetical protein